MTFESGPAQGHDETAWGRVWTVWKGKVCQEDASRSHIQTPHVPAK